MLGTDIFYQYLFQFHQLPMEGLGEILLKRTPAKLSMLDKQIEPPVYNIEFLNESTDPTHFVSWISGHLSVSYDEAESSIKCYIQYIKEIVAGKGRLEWNHLGEWMADESGNVYFTGFPIHAVGQKKLAAEKLIRSKPNHEVLIGDQTYSGDRLHHLLEKNKKKLSKSRFTLVLSGLITIAAAVVIYCFIKFPAFKSFHQIQPKLNIQQHQEKYKIINAE